jgi:hypothetical protein
MADGRQTPKPGDRILIFKPESLALVLQGKKTMDARKVNYKPGRILLGCDGRIHAVAQLTRAFVVESVRVWERLRQHHRSVEKALPYSPKTFMFRIRVLNKLPLLSYRHPQGAISIVVYQP